MIRIINVEPTEKLLNYSQTTKCHPRGTEDPILFHGLLHSQLLLGRREIDKQLSFYLCIYLFLREIEMAPRGWQIAILIKPFLRSSNMLVSRCALLHKFHSNL